MAVSAKPGFQYIDKDEILLTGVRQIVFLGDVGCTGFVRESQRVVSAILKEPADLFFILGDLVHRGQEQDYREFLAFFRDKVQVPIFTLPGNHDLPEYSRFFGLMTYSLVLENAVLISLNNSRRVLSPDDREFLERQLKKYPQKKSIILFHIPPPNDLESNCMSLEEWGQVSGLLKRYQEQVACLVCAHVHAFRDYEIDGFRVIITGGGGANLAHLGADQMKKHHAVRLQVGQELVFEVIPVEQGDLVDSGI
jgi:3',5'-cyclic AMP phosphodiesterase CpdA